MSAGGRLRAAGRRRGAAGGKRVKEIAHALGINAKTVESHRQNIMDKLEIHSTIELTRYALRKGLTSI
jgi:DNA-binding NarL/FixJ family response regulator